MTTTPSRSRSTSGSSVRNPRRRPSNGNITYPIAISQREADEIMPLLTVLMPNGRSAPINPNARPPIMKYSASVETSILTCRALRVGHLVVARRWSHSTQRYKDWTEGQVEGFFYDEEGVPMLTIRHVNQHTQKGYNEVYRIRSGDQVESFKGDLDGVLQRLQARPESVAPIMGSSRAGPSRAISTAVAHRW